LTSIRRTARRSTIEARRWQNYPSLHNFITSEKLSHCPRGHFFYRHGVGFNVFCFSEREHAERFLKQLGGEFIDPKDRSRWPGGG
jgi:hypothetical protein